MEKATWQGVLVFPPKKYCQELSFWPRLRNAVRASVPGWGGSAAN